MTFGGVYPSSRPPGPRPPPSNWGVGPQVQEREGDYSQRVVMFLRQPDIFEQLESRMGEAVSDTLRSVG